MKVYRLNDRLKTSTFAEFVESKNRRRRNVPLHASFSFKVLEKVFLKEWCQINCFNYTKLLTLPRIDVYILRYVLSSSLKSELISLDDIFILPDESSLGITFEYIARGCW